MVKKSRRYGGNPSPPMAATSTGASLSRNFPSSRPVTSVPGGARAGFVEVACGAAVQLHVLDFASQDYQDEVPVAHAMSIISRNSYYRHIL